jgi:anti-sigma factor RsiW
MLSADEMAELAALADGTLPAERRGAVEERVAASPELQELLERQRRGVLAAQSLAADEVPASLQAAVERHRRALDSSRGAKRRLVPRLSLAAVAAIAAAVVAAVVLSGGPGAPTVAEAARLAQQPPAEPAPPSAGTRLALAVDGVSFPDYARAYGWRPLGVRRGEVDGRKATVVFYGKDGRRIAYVIVAGTALPRPADTRTSVVRGAPYQTLRLNGKLAVTWRNGGHTCILVGDAPGAELLRLASWPLTR